MTSTEAEQKRIKALGEYGPLIGFFIAYWLYGLNVATGVLVGLTVIAMIITRWKLGKFPLMPMIAAGLVVFFGGLTIIFDDDRFIKMKPTIVQVALAIVLAGSAYMQRPLLATMMAGQIVLSPLHWKRLSYRYSLFFLAMAGINEYIWRNFSTDFWVNFKFFGLTGITLAFSLTQVAFIMRHNQNTDT